MMQALAALSVAHEMGVVHRDPQAREHHGPGAVQDDEGRATDVVKGLRFRHREDHREGRQRAERVGREADDRRPRHRHARVHVPRAGARREARRAERPLLDGGRPLPPADAPGAVRGRERRVGVVLKHARRAAAAFDALPGGSAARGGVPEGDAQASRRALRHGAGDAGGAAGRRRCAGFGGRSVPADRAERSAWRSSRRARTQPFSSGRSILARARLDGDRFADADDARGEQHGAHGHVAPSPEPTRDERQSIPSLPKTSSAGCRDGARHAASPSEPWAGARRITSRTTTPAPAPVASASASALTSVTSEAGAEPPPLPSGSASAAGRHHGARLLLLPRTASRRRRRRRSRPRSMRPTTARRPMRRVPCPARPAPSRWRSRRRALRHPPRRSIRTRRTWSCAGCMPRKCRTRRWQRSSRRRS